MKKFIYSILLSIFVLFPINVLATGNITISTSSLSIELGSSKTFTISAYNTIGDVSIKSSNSSIASVNTGSWSTGMVEEKQTKTGNITVTGNSIGNTTIILTLDAATFDEEDLSGQTRIINVNVIAKSTTTTTTTTQKTTTTSKIITSKSTTPNSTSQTQKVNTTNKTEKTTQSTSKKNLSNNTNLKSITINDKSVDLSLNEEDYDINVSYETENINIKLELSDSKASYRIDGDTNLKEGINIIKIIVLAEDNITEKTYTLNITRKEKDAVLSSNAFIKSLKIDGYKLNFNTNNNNYDLTIKNEDKLNIDVVLEDNLSSYKIIGNNNLKDKSVIKVVVTAEDGNSITYYINISKKSSIWLLIVISIISLIIIGLVVYLLKTKGKKNNKIKEEIIDTNITDKSDEISKNREILFFENDNLK